MENEKVSLFLDKLRIKKTSNFKNVFYNHVDTFFKRIENNEKVNFELNEELLKQVPKQFMDEAREFVYEIYKDTNINVLIIDEIEYFLIATHFMSAERN